MEKTNLINVQDELGNVTALVTLIQRASTLKDDFSLDEIAKYGFFLLLTNIIDRLTLIQSLLNAEGTKK